MEFPGFPIMLSHSKVHLFKKTDLFETLSEAAIQQVLQGCREILLKPGQCLFKEGESGDSMYLIYSGEIVVHRQGKQLAKRGPGEYFGEMGMIQADRRSASAKAVGETHLLELDREKFYSKLANRPQTLNALLKTLSSRSREDLESLGQDQDKLQSQTKLNTWLKDLLDNTREEIYVFDPKTCRIKNANACTEKNLGYSIRELIQKTPFDLLRDLTREKFEKMAGSLTADKTASILIEDFNVRKDGSSYPVETRVRMLKTGNHSVYVAVTQDKSEVKELEKIKDQAVKANQAKSEFLSKMSHELRTPLNAILGFGQLLEFSNEEPLSQAQREWLQEILRAGNFLLEIINEILNLAHIESGKISLSLESFDLAELIQEVLPLVSPLAQKSGIRIDNDTMKHGALIVCADRTKLKQVLLNLISNAIKYNRKNGSVTLRAKRKENGSIHVSVTDTGMGIPEEKLGNLFQPFDRLGAEESEVEGTGLGLVIAKQLVERMQGTISVQSTVGKGTCFTIGLPAPKQAAEPVKPQSSAEELESESDAEEKRSMVLYVEDNAANKKLVEQIVKPDKTIDLITMGDAESGILLARRQRPDLILMDINLPGKDGVAALRELKSLEETKTIPVIAVTANVTTADIQNYKLAGFEAHIAKPIDVTTFLKTIRTHLDQEQTAAV